MSARLFYPTYCRQLFRIGERAEKLYTFLTIARVYLQASKSTTFLKRAILAFSHAFSAPQSTLFKAAMAEEMSPEEIARRKFRYWLKEKNFLQDQDLEFHPDDDLLVSKVVSLKQIEEAFNILVIFRPGSKNSR